jgi:DNA-binding IclR family transcriptional regulator
MVSTLEINQRAAASVHKLSKRTGLIARIGIWDDDAPMVTLEVDPGYIADILHQVGPRVVAYCSTLGRVFLAHMKTLDLNSYFEKADLKPLTPYTITDPETIKVKLNEVHEKGYTFSREELVLGWSSMAAPIFQKDGSVAAALCLSGETNGLSGDNINFYAAELLKTAADVSEKMGYRIRFI